MFPAVEGAEDEDMTTTTAPAIRLRGLRKTYGSVVAVDDIDLEVAPGEILGVLGPNGAGKSTMIDCVAGLTRPDAGTVEILGIDPWRDRATAKRDIGVQLQQAGLQPKLRVGEALELFASFYEDPRDPDELADRLGLTERLGHAWTALSGGQQQRLSIALALIGRPRIALLDELSTGLDPASRREVWSIVREVRESGTTVVLVTHLMEEAQFLCDRLAVIEQGRLIALDTPAGLVGSTAAPAVMRFAPSAQVAPDLLRTFDGVADVTSSDQTLQVVTDDDGILAVLDHLAAEGIRPHGLRITDSSLDEAYLDVVRRESEGADR